MVAFFRFLSFFRYLAFLLKRRKKRAFFRFLAFWGGGELPTFSTANMLNRKSRKSWPGPTWANIGSTYEKKFWGPTCFREFRVKMLARANIVYMDPLNEPKFFGANMFSGILGQMLARANKFNIPGLNGNFEKCWQFLPPISSALPYTSWLAPLWQG